MQEAIDVQHLRTMLAQEDLTRKQAENARWTVRLTVIAIVVGVLSSVVTVVLTDYLDDAPATQEASE